MRQNNKKKNLNSAFSLKKKKDFFDLRAKYSKLAKTFRVHFFHQKRPSIFCIVNLYSVFKWDTFQNRKYIRVRLPVIDLIFCFIL